VTLTNAKKTSGWVQSPPYKLTSYKGRPLYLLFYAVNDGSYPTDFQVDDVTLTPVFGYPPVVTSFKVNGTAKSTVNAAVKLTNATKNSPTHYMASEDPGFAAGWEIYSRAPVFALSAGSGEKTVYFKVKNRFDESPVVSDPISALGPEVTSFKINNGSATTAESAQVKLNNVTKNSPTHYMASEDLGFAGATWQIYSKAPPFIISPGYGIKTVYFKVRNGFAESPGASDTILVPPPTVASFEID